MGARAAVCPTKSIPVRRLAGTAMTPRCGVSDMSWAVPHSSRPAHPYGSCPAHPLSSCSVHLHSSRPARPPNRGRPSDSGGWPPAGGPCPARSAVVPWSMIEISREEFEEAVNDALDSLPDQIAEAIAHANVAILIEEEPDPQTHGMELLGLYQGIPLDQRSVFQGFAEPDRILIFRGPLQRLARDRQDRKSTRLNSSHVAISYAVFC